ncbi:SCP2 sterol-binding domain-containing protein, partial [Vibrio vulnificus]
MPFEPLITAVIETSLNVLVKDNPDLEKRLLRLKGQVIQVHLQELNKTLTFIFSQQIDVLANYEGQPDCYLSLKLAVLPELRE